MEYRFPVHIGVSSINWRDNMDVESQVQLFVHVEVVDASQPYEPTSKRLVFPNFTAHPNAKTSHPILLSTM